MPQQQGSSARLLIDTETTFKTTPGTPDAQYLPLVSESIGLKRVLHTSKTIRSSRNPNKPSAGKMEVAGDIAFEMAPQYLRLLKHIFGSAAGAASPYTYKIGALPAGMVLEKQFPDVDSTEKFALYNGCRVGSFRLAGGQEGFCEGSVSILGAKETLGSASFDATARDLGFSAFDAISATLTEGGSGLVYVTNWDILLENNLDGNNYVIDGTGERRSLPAGVAKVSGKLSCLFETFALYKKAIDRTQTSLSIVLKNGTGAGTLGNEKLSFFMDEMLFSPNSPVIKGPTGLLIDLPFEAWYNTDPDASALRATLEVPNAATDL